MEHHLDEELPLDDLARLAAFSPCHFHRVFRAVTLEGVAEHRRRLRLERAARRLRMGSQPIIEIALEAGYEAHESFTRAFEAMYGVAPSRYRAERGLALIHTAPELPRIVGVVEPVGPLHLVRLRHVGPYHEVGRAFDRLSAWVGMHGLFGPWTQTMGLCYDDPEVVDPKRLRYDAAFVVPREVAGEGEIEYYRLPAGDYLKTLHRGPYSELSTAYSALIRGYLLEYSRPLAEAPSVEFYRNSPDGSSAESLATEICLPLMEEHG